MQVCLTLLVTDGTVTLAGKTNPDQETDEFYFADGENVASLNKSFRGGCQWRVQDLKEGGAKPNRTRSARAKI